MRIRKEMERLKSIKDSHVLIAHHPIAGNMICVFEKVRPVKISKQGTNKTYVTAMTLLLNNIRKHYLNINVKEMNHQHREYEKKELKKHLHNFLVISSKIDLTNTADVTLTLAAFNRLIQMITTQSVLLTNLTSKFIGLITLAQYISIISKVIINKVTRTDRLENEINIMTKLINSLKGVLYTIYTSIDKDYFLLDGGINVLADVKNMSISDAYTKMMSESAIRAKAAMRTDNFIDHYELSSLLTFNVPSFILWMVVKGRFKSTESVSLDIDTYKGNLTFDKSLVVENEKQLVERKRKFMQNFYKGNKIDSNLKTDHVILCNYE
jgi:hypothetical protein